MIGDFRVTNLGFRAHDALSYCGRRRKKGAGDFFGGQVADFAQRQRHLRVRRQRRVAAGEDQPQAIVFHVFATPVGLFEFFQLRQQQWLRSLEPRAPAQHINRLEASGRDQPGARVVRHAVALPAFDRDEERLVQGFFGKVEITEQADQRCQNPS